jgi:hypothetical protein|tara:strand:- start:58 stop:390 length:333 start_codon:yes stop_codon:yes gene_type:complete
MGRGEQFSYEALEVLFDYYEMGCDDYNLDVIEICCEWSEYDSIAALKENYSSFLSDQIIEGDPDDVEGILEGTKDNDIISAIQDVTEIFEVVSNDYLNGINRTSHLVREF